MIKNLSFYEKIVDQKTVANYQLISHSEDNYGIDIYVELAKQQLPKIIKELKKNNQKAKISILFNHLIYIIHNINEYSYTPDSYTKIISYLKLEKIIIKKLRDSLREESTISRLFLYSIAINHISNHTLKSYLNNLKFYSGNPDSNILLNTSDTIQKAISDLEVILSDVKKLKK